MLAFLWNFLLNTKGIGHFIDVKQDKYCKDNKNGDHQRFPPVVHIYDYYNIKNLQKKIVKRIGRKVGKKHLQLDCTLGIKKT
jgi:hypothetical protein